MHGGEWGAEWEQFHRAQLKRKGGESGGASVVIMDLQRGTVGMGEVCGVGSREAGGTVPGGAPETAVPTALAEDRVSKLSWTS